ncbi:MAG: glycosyltransferase [Propionibacteriaceae bacterium]|jgi:glycosyltransferase involved in cell wall biosynthesis|nr:glycosyltransferase [Propionibacteriaceae bacterium]
MKIALATDLYHPMINGVAVFTWNLAQGLVQRGHEVTVVAPSLTGEPTVEEDAGVRVVRLSSTKMPFYPDQVTEAKAALEFRGRRLPPFVYKNGIHVSWRPYSEIKAAFDDFRPDVVHNQTVGPVSIAILRYCRNRDVALVTTGHAYPDNITGQVALPRSLKRPIDEVVRRYFVHFLTHSEYVTMPTEYAIVDIALKGREKDFAVPIKAISNGIDLAEFSPGPATPETYGQFGLPPDRPLVGIVGRIDREKSMDVLLRAFRRVADFVPDVFFAIAGDGRDRDRLESLADELVLGPRLRWLGRVDRAELPDLYRAFHVFATTSETETQGIVIMEAMATGLPVVGVTAGALEDIVKDGRNGYAVPPRNPEATAAAITRLLQDRSLRETFGAASLEIVAKHNLDDVLGEFEDIYRQVLANRRTESGQTGSSDSATPDQAGSPGSATPDQAGSTDSATPDQAGSPDSATPDQTGSTDSSDAA